WSTPGKGTTFTAFFPAARSLSKEPDTARGPEQGALPSMSGTVLLVDDETSVRAVGREMLEAAGLTVLTASSGAEALEQMSEHADEIGCVLLDVTMPRMSGEETLRALREIREDVRVIMCSGYSQQEVGAQFADKGVAGVVHKPYRIADLLRVLQGCMS
ncbi:MAG: response regulator, partial [Candidatus Hydrogenedentes bacterium]|nr:response regulator [Candidatus Hydrogenedentota bacterium]